MMSGKKIVDLPLRDSAPRHRRRPSSREPRSRVPVMVGHGLGSRAQGEIEAVQQVTVDTIENDQFIRDQIMWMANLYRPDNCHPMASLDEAIAQFGFATIKHLALLLARSRHEQPTP